MAIMNFLIDCLAVAWAIGTVFYILFRIAWWMGWTKINYKE